jgi:hypothetical protein
MKYQEIITEVKEKYSNNVSRFAFKEKDTLDKSGEFTEVSQKGGKGEGDEWYSVKYFKDHNIYIRVDGYYTSYEGTEFEDWDYSCGEVKPIERLVTFYESE